MMTDIPDFLLASASPRRQELLQQIGARFRVRPVDLCEAVLSKELANDYVVRLATAKAQKGWQQQGELVLPVLGADTSVVLDDGNGNEQIFGKPVDQQQAVTMLMQLSGRSHRVVTGVALFDGERLAVRLVETLVYFRSLTEQECVNYWLTGEPADKAGAYGIQGLGAVFVRKISGSYSNVVGLPLTETAELLAEFGIGVWRSL